MALYHHIYCCLLCSFTSLGFLLTEFEIIKEDQKDVEGHQIEKPIA